MCMFSGAVTGVSGTNIFARHDATFAFAAVPDHKTIGAIDLALFEILERAVA